MLAILGVCWVLPQGQVVSAFVVEPLVFIGNLLDLQMQ